MCICSTVALNRFAQAPFKEAAFHICCICWSGPWKRITAQSLGGEILTRFLGGEIMLEVWFWQCQGVLEELVLFAELLWAHRLSISGGSKNCFN